MKKLKRYAVQSSCDCWQMVGAEAGPYGYPDESYCDTEDVAELEAALAEAVELLREAKQHVSGWTSTGEDIAAFLKEHGKEDQ